MKLLFIKKFLKCMGFLLLFITSVLFLYLAGAYIFSHITVNKEDNQPEEMPIYISTNGMHTDLIFPIKTEEIDWSKDIKYNQTSSKDSIQNYISIGWGDRGFFLDVPDWDHVKVSVAFKAAFGLSSTAIHTTYLKSVEDEKEYKKIMISKDQYKRLIKYIQQYFKRDEKGNLINIITSNTYGENDSFYEAKGTYQLFFTCNTWVNSALKNAGLKACLWTPFQQGIFNQYK